MDLRVEAFRVYEWMDFWGDLRFYIGWVIGLFIAPAPVPDMPPGTGADGWPGRR